MLLSFDIYILRQHAVPFFLSFFVYTFVLIMNRLFELVDLIFGKGLDPGTVGLIFLYSLPFIIAITAPMAFLTSVLAVFGRMSEDFEVIAAKALGINPLRLLVPLVFFATVFILIMVYFNNHILPETNHRVKLLLLEVGEKRPVAELAPRSFISNFPGYLIYARAINKSSNPAKLEDVLLLSKSEVSQENSEFIISKEASISIDREWNMITFKMNEGQRHILGQNGSYWTMAFDTQTINILLPPEARPDTSYRGDREMSAQQMIQRVNSWQRELDSLEKTVMSPPSTEFPENEALITSLDVQIKSLKSEINRYSVEIHKKYSLPFAALTFIFLGVPLGILSRKGGMGAAFGIAILITTIYYIFIVGGETLSDRGFLNPAISMWSANVFFLTVGLWLYHGFFFDSIHFWKR
ncbi:LptF/LptG family permease [candidate division WOR-3 bacterium]|nr:LptF/LptG family permease [candidate division WOR-3 bacterium]